MDQERPGEGDGELCLNDDPDHNLESDRGNVTVDSVDVEDTDDEDFDPLLMDRYTQLQETRRPRSMGTKRRRRTGTRRRRRRTGRTRRTIKTMMWRRESWT